MFRYSFLLFSFFVGDLQLHIGTPQETKNPNAEHTLHVCKTVVTVDSNVIEVV